jgi:hypothetical protein
MKSSTTKARFRKVGLGSIAVSSVLFMVSPFLPSGTAQAQERVAAVTPVVRDFSSDWLAKSRPYDNAEKLLIQHEARLPSGQWSDADPEGQVTPSIDSLIDQISGQPERVNPTTGAVNGPATTSNEIPTLLAGSTAQFRVRVYNRRGLNATDVTVVSSTDTGVFDLCSATGTVAMPVESYIEYECEVPGIGGRQRDTLVDIISTITVTGRDRTGAVRFQGTEVAAINVVKANATIITRVRQAGTTGPFLDADSADVAAMIDAGADAEFEITVVNTSEVDIENAKVTTNGGCEIQLGTLAPLAQVVYTRTGITVTGDPAAAARLAGTLPTAGCLVSRPTTGGFLNATLMADARLGAKTVPLMASNPAYYKVLAAPTTTTIAQTTTTAPRATTTIPQVTTTAPATLIPVITAAPAPVAAPAPAAPAAPAAAAPTTTAAAPASVAGATATTAAPATAPATVLGTVFENAPEGDLPVTGSASDSLMYVSFGLLLVGGALVLLSMTSFTLRKREE